MVRGRKNELLPADKVMQNVGHLNKNNEIHFVSNFSGKKKSSRLNSITTLSTDYIFVNYHFPKLYT